VNDNDGQDEIRFSLDGTTYGTYLFKQGTIRNSSLGTVVEETTASHVAFEIWERDYPLTTTIDSVTLNCGVHRGRQAQHRPRGSQRRLHAQLHGLLT
jgi:hypothetical protein